MKFQGFFIKIGELQWLEKLQKQGEVYCNTLHYFATEEDKNKARKDKNEIAQDYQVFKNNIISLKPNNSEFKPIQIKTSRLQLIQSLPNALGNLYCLFSVNMLAMPSEGKIEIDIKNREFGDFGLVLTNPDEFQNRLEKAIKKMGLIFFKGFVEYIDLKELNGKKSVFQKDNSYSFQNEFRYFIQNTEQTPLKFCLGDISDISTMIKLENEIRYKKPNL
jgi:hypothetical protein